MTGDLIGSIILWLIVAIVFIAAIAYLFSWLYHRTTKEVAFVRTGMGGETVVINGGALVLPIVHEITPVSLNVLRVQVKRIREQAVISRDRLRVDIEAEFFVRVIQEPAAVAAAASTLGRKALETDGFDDLLSGKFISALRSVAAEMSLDEMHENGAGFVAKVEERAAEALARNGLELESVAITDLDQTDLEFFKPANRFDAEGLTQLVDTIETRRKMRNDIEQSSVVAIRARNLEAEQETLKLEQLSEGSRLNQERELEIMRAEQRAEITRTRASNEAQAESARIQNEQATRELEIARQRTVQESEIRAQEEVEKARIGQQQALESSRIVSDAQLQQARSENQIAVLQMQSEEAKTRIETEDLHARVVAAEEAVVTLRETVIAERTATVDKLLAEKDADSALIAAEADKVTAAVAAEAERLSNEAENTLSEDARATRLRARMIDRLEGIVRESVKPMKNIEGIKILHVDGLGGNSGSGTRSPTDEVIESALRYRAQAPLIDEMLKEIGVENPGVSRMGDIFRSAKDVQSIADNQNKTKKDD
ncbi:MAG: flotillin domain-containing protein [Granulosicoccaceae bacterium]